MQLAGAFFGAILTWLHWLPHFKTVPEPPCLNPGDMLLRKRDMLPSAAMQIISYDTRPQYRGGGGGGSASEGEGGKKVRRSKNKRRSRWGRLGGSSPTTAVSLNQEPPPPPTTQQQSQQQQQGGGKKPQNGHQHPSPLQMSPQQQPGGGVSQPPQKPHLATVSPLRPKMSVGLPITTAPTASGRLKRSERFTKRNKGCGSRVHVLHKRLVGTMRAWVADLVYYMLPLYRPPTAALQVDNSDDDSMASTIGGSSRYSEHPTSIVLRTSVRL